MGLSLFGSGSILRGRRLLGTYRDRTVAQPFQQAPEQRSLADKRNRDGGGSSHETCRKQRDGEPALVETVVHLPTNDRTDC